MDFFGIGGGEILLIIIVALFLWGPGRLTEIARTVGKTVRALRRATSDFTSTIVKEVEAEKEEKTRPPAPETERAAPPGDSSVK